MNKKDIDNYLSHYIPRLYSFAFSLIPDELQAQQLVLDAYYVISLRSREKVEDLLRSSKSMREDLERELLITIYHQIMDIAVKREGHLQLGLGMPKSHNRFYSIPARERAVLFLKHKSDLSTDEIGFILGGDRVVAISHLNIARKNIIETAVQNNFKATVGL